MEALRSWGWEVHLKLHSFILDNMESILNEWESFARSIPPGEGMDVSGLRDHAEEILETIARDMCQEESREEQSLKSRGRAAENKPALKVSREHAHTRRVEGFTLNQVVAEYRAMRTSVIQLWTAAMEPSELSVYELVRFNEGLDQALTYVIEQYSSLVEQDRKQWESKLREADTRKDEFLATLAHELRNPLAPIQAGIEVLRMTEQVSPAAQAPLDMMGRQMGHLVRLVDDLLNVSRISQGKINLQLEKLDINRAVREALEETHDKLYAGRREIKVDLPDEPVHVQADPSRTVQIVSNLLSNAAKHTSDAGRVWITVNREGQQATISVADDGEGISSEDLEGVFNLFAQAKSSPKEGLGIGLALVRKLVELQGGRIQVHSRGLGLGSEFRVCLPIFAADDSVLEEDAGTQGGGEVAGDLSGRRVLIMDDNADAAEALAMLLDLLGAQTTTVHESRSALQEFERLEPDTALLDLGMPGMDGYEVAKKIRSHPLGQNTTLIAVTGFGQEEDRQRTWRGGFNGHLVKPVEIGDLQRVLGRAAD